MELLGHVHRIHAFFVGLFSALFFAGLLLHWWIAAVLMAGATGISLIAWMWPRPSLGQRVHDDLMTGKAIQG